MTTTMMKKQRWNGDLLCFALHHASSTNIKAEHLSFCLSQQAVALSPSLFFSSFSSTTFGCMMDGKGQILAEFSFLPMGFLLLLFPG